MAKKAKTRKAQYREILAKYGKNLDDCDIMAFRFADEYRPDIFHFELMNPLRPVYHLFDASGNVAIVIVPKDPENARKMALLAESCGGEKTTPNLW